MVDTEATQKTCTLSADQKQFLNQPWFNEFGYMNSAGTEVTVAGRFIVYSSITDTE